MQKTNNIFIDFVLVSLVPAILISCGWYLGQLHQSGYDVAGIFLFITGAIGLILAFLLRSLTKKYSWHNTWFAKLLTGVLSCGIIFIIILLLARLHG